METKNIFGRKQELLQLKQLSQKKTASLVVFIGRRRIGKSYLAEHFSKDIENFYQFQGLGPRPNQTNQDQLNYFAEQLSKYFNLPAFKLKSWSEAFSLLSQQTQLKPACILLDEISWMGEKDKDFAAKLKIAWDTQFKHNKNLILIVCGSVSTWIQKNILNKTDFVGRISLAIKLEELTLSEAHSFWTKNNLKIGLDEKLNALLLTGGVPKYLEEIANKQSIDTQINDKCFHKNGFFFQEFDRVFSDIFGKKTQSHKRIVQALSTKSMTASELAKKIKKPLNGKITDSLNSLCLSGFLNQEIIYSLNGKPTDKVIYRLKDNYLRFYLRLIEERKNLILKSDFKLTHFSSLLDWNVFKGQQFENLIYSSSSQILDILQINSTYLLSAAPYLQKKNSRNKMGCQIDLLINEKNKNYYVCEIKNSALTNKIIGEVEKKIDALKLSNKCTIRPVLITSEKITEMSAELRDYFYKIITFEDLLNG